MIRSESEYKEAVARLRKEQGFLDEQRRQLDGMGLGPEEIKRAMDPMKSFHLQLVEEVESYERLKRGEFREFENFNGIGQLLIGARIACGLTQSELAVRLSVDPSQVSRDERNEYHGVTMERATKILEALGGEISVHTTVEYIPSKLAG